MTSSRIYLSESPELVSTKKELFGYLFISYNIRKFQKFIDRTSKTMGKEIGNLKYI